MDESVASKPGLAGEVVSYLLLGSEESFDAFVAAQAPALQRTAFLLTGDHGAAEELVQDTLLRVWARWSRVVAADQPVAYVRRMLVNASVSRWRRMRGRQSFERLTAQPPERAVSDSFGVDPELWRLVGLLPPRQRAVVVLTYYEDMSEGEVAELLGTAVGTVKSQRAKALRTLRAELAKEEA